MKKQRQEVAAQRRAATRKKDADAIVVTPTTFLAKLNADKATRASTSTMRGGDAKGKAAGAKWNVLREDFLETDWKANEGDDEEGADNDNDNDDGDEDENDDEDE